MLCTIPGKIMLYAIYTLRYSVSIIYEEDGGCEKNHIWYSMMITMMISTMHRGAERCYVYYGEEGI
jgi:hypothetical protein